MSDLAFFGGFFILIIFLAFTVSTGNKGLFSGTGTSTTPTYETPRNGSGSTPSYSSGAPTYAPVPEEQSTEPELTPAQVEARVASIYAELDRLRRDIREARLREPASPYRDLVRLSSGNVYENDPDREYITLYAQSTNPTPINISGWHLESYVSGEKATIPEGDRIIDRWRSPEEEDILIEPGETAYLVSGTSPLDVSFRENMCTGYLNDEEDFYPMLTERCPYPKNELERYGKIELDDDRCYEFIERLYSCTAPLEESYDHVSSRCTTFIENTFNYNDCVRLHRYDPYFTQGGYWRIFLDERTDLWRERREIIRLLDEHDRVVSVLEY